ncbi:cobyrinate a,c-diamide synthase [Oscillospiraceae bacterium LTW-04]|nr:cobyrinate a,c-diamide synthase [Oscillospiraceae bacterium MB24-C1]
MLKKLPRLLLAAPSSGQGKTTLTLALLRAFQLAGKRPVAFKSGPDYIDPMFHRRVLGLPSYNLDLFLSDAPTAVRLLAECGSSGDLALIEGAMGYYDGVGITDEASAYALAKATHTPVVLLLSAKGAALSLAATVHGFNNLRSPSHLAGVVLNRCTQTLYDRVAPIITKETGLSVLGFLPDLPQCTLQSRHLGLVTADEIADLSLKLDRLGEAAAQSIDLLGLLQLAQTAPPLEWASQVVMPAPNRVRLAVARDDAFCFYYDETLALFEALGVELMFFSPLQDAQLPPKAQALYLGGGYPELYAGQLSQNCAMLQSVRNAIADGMPCLAECGGFLYLHAQMQDDKGAFYPMVGVIEGTAIAGTRLGHFGYITLTARRDNLLCRAGETLSAHEFHYWQSDSCGEDFKAIKPDGRAWDAVHATSSLFAGFPHLYLQGNIMAAKNFLAAAAAYGEKYGFSRT